MTKIIISYRGTNIPRVFDINFQTRNKYTIKLIVQKYTQHSWCPDD